MNNYCNDLTGKRNGKLLGISYSHSKNWKAYWLCQCDCGNQRILESRRLTDKKYKSCGECPKIEKIKKPKLIKDEKYWINKWVKRNLLRNSSDIFLSRRLLNIDDVVKLAINAKIKFPYMSFIGNCNKAFYASIDRIDSSKDYSDINNIRIIPLWLNAAKMQLSENELKQLMRDYLNG